MKDKIIMLLNKNIGEYLYKVRLKQNILKQNTKSRITKEKTKKLD